MLQRIFDFSLALYRLVFPIRPYFHHKITICNTLLLDTNLEKRAKPNKRLIIAFGIENAFTTISEDLHRNFLHKVEDALNKSNNDSARIELAQNAIKIGTEYIKRSAQQEHAISLSKLVQVVAFRIILTIFFPHVARSLKEDGRMNDTDVEIISEKINTLWYDSKSPWKIFCATYFPPHFSSIMKDRETLLTHLELQFPWYRTYLPQRNPLNILIPAHQGLWRVVLRCFIEVRFRSSDADRETWSKLFEDFLKAPTECWHKPNEEGLDVQMIIAETLRLYPPTPRMYVQQDDGSLDAIDIQTMHRTGERWAPDPLRYRPDRWIHNDNEELDVVDTDNYMPFGRKVDMPKGARTTTMSQCPSRLRGGPKLIAILVGALLEVVDQKWELEEVKDRNDDVSGNEPLRSGRDAYEGLRLRRKLDA
ncbi:hypothetical protein EG329_009919 [Mollisiaceae sp. DMI_Dod_QoI]|nr:hypothetical protein EG329_009919 [Helotiales sp. DMI_Dod_QoI]